MGVEYTRSIASGHHRSRNKDKEHETQHTWLYRPQKAPHVFGLLHIRQHVWWCLLCMQVSEHGVVYNAGAKLTVMGKGVDRQEEREVDRV